MQARRLRLLAARLGEAEERERVWLARDLYDRVGQNLAALGVSLALTRADLGKDRLATLPARLDAAEELLTETANSICGVLLDPPRLSPSVANVLYRIAQEAMERVSSWRCSDGDQRCAGG
jgi:signal transduction histidine kinase